jgi:hypothetical protein
MEYRAVIQVRLAVPDREIIGAKEAIAETLDGIGCDVDHIRVMPIISEETDESN